MKKFKKSDIVRISVFVLFIIASIALTIYFMPQLVSLTTPEGRQAFESKLESFGIWKYVIFVFIQIVQVIIAFIPGEPIELIGGALFGWWMALILCSVGLLIGTIAVFYLVKWLGKPFISVIISEDKINKFKFLNSDRKLKLTIFILYVIPGTPKDVLTYCAPLTPIKASHFFLITMFARIPSIVSSNIIGSSATSGNWLITAIVTVITATLGIIGIWYSNKLIQKFEENERIQKMKEHRKEFIERHRYSDEKNMQD